jgi:hypothetical protein
MDNHLHALGYLLAAATFSVGFLSERIHGALNSATRILMDSSWRVRQAILENERLGPADLADLLGEIPGSRRDYIAVGSRVLNWTIFVTTCIIFGDVLGLRRNGARGPDHEFLLIVLLFGATFAVVVFSEFDVHRVAREKRDELRVSTLGRLQRLARLMEHSDITHAEHELMLLRESFPTWALPVELAAYLDLVQGRPDAARARIRSLLQTRTPLYLSPVVGAACCLRQHDSDAGLELLDEIGRRGEDIRHWTRLRRALEVTSGHLPALLADPESEPSDRASTDSSRGATAQRVLGQEVERMRHHNRNVALDLDPQRVSDIAPLMDELNAWETGDAADDLNSGVLSAFLGLILDRTPDAASKLLAPFTANRSDAAALESLGLIALTCSESRVALGYLEAAIRLSPASARAHWGRAVACHRVGWSDAAKASLKRVDALSDDSPLLSVTRSLLSGESATTEAERVYPATITNMRRFELALIGVPGSLAVGKRVRERFASALIDRAYASSQP